MPFVLPLLTDLINIETFAQSVFDEDPLGPALSPLPWWSITIETTSRALQFFNQTPIGRQSSLSFSR